MRKVWEKSPGLTEERIYLGGFEIFRKHSGPIGANTATLERETLHVMDDKQRIALVETRTLDTTGSDPAPRQLIRYQFGNHLGSASLELDEQAQIISYEEYAPYGSSTYQAVRSQTETAKRYRYTGKERDEESGLYYHVVRYYAPWLARWTAADPEGLVDGPNLFRYARSAPVSYHDPNGSQSTATPWQQAGPSATFNQTVDVARHYRSFPEFVADLPVPLNPDAPALERAWNRAHPSVTSDDKFRGVHIVEVRGGTPSALARSSSQSFTDAARAADRPGSHEVTINTNLFNGGYRFFGPGDPSGHPAEGLVISGGRRIGGTSSPSTFYAAYNQGAGDASSGGTWSFGQGDPSTASTVAFGGGKPLIVNGLPYGERNTYSASAPAGASLPAVGDPGLANRQHLTQRSNAGFTALQAEGVGVGIPIIGYDADHDVLFLIVQQSGNSDGADITQLRDELIRRGVDSALAFDGSDSATLVQDSTVVVKPAFHKNNSIPFGLTVRTP